MSKEKTVSVHVDENGNVYELKKSVWKKPLFWSTVVLSALSVFLTFVIFQAGKYVVDIDEALSLYNVSYDANTKQLQPISQPSSQENEAPILETFSFGDKSIFEEGSIQVKGAEISDGKVTFAVVFVNNTDRATSFNPEEFTAKAGNEELKYSGLTSFIGPEENGNNYGVSANSNAVFFLNYDLPKNGSKEYSIRIGQYLWK